MKQTDTLLVHGQGVFLFKGSEPTCAFTIFSDDKKNGISVEFSATGVDVFTIPDGTELKDPDNNVGLVDASGAYYWFSLDAQNQVLYAGLGEPRLETATYEYYFPTEHKAFLESLTHIVLHEDTGIFPLRILRDPVTSTVPLTVKDKDELTMEDVAAADYMPKANLSAVSQKMYECVAGKNFVLNTPDFPEFSDAIEYSIATPGCWCHETLLKKATEFSKDKPIVAETYLRITLGQNNGESPGIPYVMEIWPPGHYSPVHSHANAEAVIRVLHGSIQVQLFPFLSKDIDPFETAHFPEGDILWISPTLNQVHQLHNVGLETCVTIQCYMYDTSDQEHYDYFDYINPDGAIEKYEPDSDMEFLQFKDLMRMEWEARPSLCCRRNRR